MDFNSYVYSKAAASRIFGKNVQAVKVERDRVAVTFSDSTTASTTTAKFKEHFAERRRTLGKQITDIKGVNFNSYTYRVNQDYLVAVFPDRVSCTCGDYATQQEMGIKRGCCKHGYAVLNTLGCSSLAEFLEKQEATHTPTKAKGATPELFPLPEEDSNKYSIVYKLVFETFGLDDEGMPLDVVERFCSHQPTLKEINCFKRQAQELGYKLVAVDEQKRYAHEEF